jgi:hypothetical protein
MRSVSKFLVEALWLQLSRVGECFKTPDETIGANFSLSCAEGDEIRITTSGGSVIRISQASFVAAIAFLLKNGHVGEENSCRIGADLGTPGGLDETTRVHSSGVMVISYILPILSKTGIIGIDGGRPNRTWLNI